MKNELQGIADPIFLPRFLDYEAYPDIEYVLQSIRDIREFLDSNGGKFFSYAGLGLYFHAFDQQIPFQNFVKDAKKIQDVLEEKIFENYSWKHSVDGNLNRIYDQLFSFIQKYSDSIHITTTNYDRAVEEYCSNPNNPYFCIDGFQLQPTSGRFLWAKGDFGYEGKRDNRKDVFLYKLHGSLNWKKHTKYGMERTSEEWKPRDSNYEENMLVYPTLSPKDGYEREPYMSIRRNFEIEMKNADACIVIGFSFRDGHIDAIFEDFIKRKKLLIVLSPNAITDFRANLLKENLGDQELKTSQTSTMHNIDNHVYLMQYKLELNNVNVIIQQISSLIATIPKVL
ncbi:MAG: SIR2 family protein [Patescibacteria group bacterium]|nr:SIR2 family protein [Patescibacteria group bacterium]